MTSSQLEIAKLLQWALEDLHAIQCEPAAQGTTVPDLLAQCSDRIRAVPDADPALTDRALHLLGSDLPVDALIEALRELRAELNALPELIAPLEQLAHDLLRQRAVHLMLPDARRRVKQTLERAQGMPSVCAPLARALKAMQEDRLEEAVDELQCASQSLGKPVLPSLPSRAEARQEWPFVGILVVEDNPAWRTRALRVAEEAAQTHGLAFVAFASTLAEARTWLAQLPAEDAGRVLIVLDLGLPQDQISLEEDTWSFHHGCALAAELAAYPRIIFSGHAELLNHADALGVGEVDCVFKDEASLAALDATLAALGERMRAQLSPLRADQGELAFLHFSGNTVMVNGVEVVLTAQQYGALALVTHPETIPQPHTVADTYHSLDEVLRGGLLQGFFPVTDKTPEDFLQRCDEANGPIRRPLREALKAIKSTLKAAQGPVWSADEDLVEREEEADTGGVAYHTRCVTRVIASPYERGLYTEDLREFRVLVVEDEQRFRDRLVRALRPHFEVCAVADGAEFQEALARCRYQAVVLDLEFPSGTAKGTEAGLAAYELLVASDLTDNIVVYSWHDTDTVRARLNRPLQMIPAHHWEKLLKSRVRRLVSKNEDTTESQLATILVELWRARRERRTRAHIPGGGGDDIPHEVALPARRLSVRRGATDALEFIVDGNLTHTVPTRGGVPQENAACGYRLLQLLAQAPCTWHSAVWLVERLVEDGLLPSPAPREKPRDYGDYLTRAVGAIRLGIDAVCPGLGEKLLANRERSYRLLANSRLEEDAAWQHSRTQSVQRSS